MKFKRFNRFSLNSMTTIWSRMQKWPRRLRDYNICVLSIGSQSQISYLMALSPLAFYLVVPQALGLLGCQWSLAVRWDLEPHWLPSLLHRYMYSSWDTPEMYGNVIWSDLDNLQPANANGWDVAPYNASYGTLRYYTNITSLVNSLSANSG